MEYVLKHFLKFKNYIFKTHNHYNSIVFNPHLQKSVNSMLHDTQGHKLSSVLFLDYIYVTLE